MKKHYKHKEPPLWFSIPVTLLVLVLVMSFCTSCAMEGWFVLP